MITQRKNIDINHPITNGIHQTVFVCDAAAPQTMLFSFQWFGFADTSKRMFKNICQQGRDTLHYAFIPCPLPILQIFFGSGKKLYFHISSNLITRPRPFLMSSCPCRIISAIAGEDIRYSVSSIACFFAVNFFRYFTAFCIRLSSSAIMLNSRNNSAFNCNAVINPPVLDFDGKVTT